MVSTGRRKFFVLWLCIATFEELGTPITYHKFSGGLTCQFLGYNLDYCNIAVGVSGKRGQLLLEFLSIYMRRFVGAEFFCG